MWKRSQSVSSVLIPSLGARNPSGVVSAPTTKATSHAPERICPRATERAVAPEAQAAYELATWVPLKPKARAMVDPAT